MRHVLLTGSSGFIGSRILENLSDDFSFFGISRSQGFDIKSYESLKNINFDAKVIIHSAASLSEDIDDVFLNNVLGTFNVCKYAKENSVEHIVLISSISVFECSENEYFKSYAFTKKQAEEIAINYCKENNITLTILRLSQVYDERRKAIKTQGMLYGFVDSVKINKKVNIFGKKNPIRNYVFVDDVVEIIKRCVNERLEGAFNIVNPKNHTLSDVAYMIFEMFKMQPEIKFIHNEPDALSIYVPVDNLYKEGFEYLDLIDGLKRIIDYEK